jgi:23S rRNA (cytidine2498-2'-O)-methyltransferase
MHDFKQGHACAFVVTTASGLEAKARSELRKLLGGADFGELFLKGNILLLADLPEAEVAARVRDAETTYVGHLSPVQFGLSMPEGVPDYPGWAAAIAEAGALAPGKTFTVRCNRRGSHDWQSRDLEKTLALAVEQATGAQGEYLIATDFIVSVEVYQDIAFVGISPSDHVVKKEIKEKRKYAPGERPLNRAQWKLQEALREFDIIPHPDARALDVGSAPGGWASVLAGLCAEVVAVDPADLDPSVTALANVRHLRCRTEELMAMAAELGEFDILTNDMNLDPDESARLMCRLADLLKEGAPAVMTIKFVTGRRREHEREAREMLAGRYENVVIRRLPHNKMETTAAMVRRKRP